MFTSNESSIIAQALQIIESKRLDTNYFNAVEISKSHAIIANAMHTKEVFSVFFLNSKYQLIKREEFGAGTIDACAVYPREIAKRALELNTAAVVLSHNHPSGDLSASEADKRTTLLIVKALGYFDVKVLDHIITGHGKASSFAELGLI